MKFSKFFSNIQEAPWYRSFLNPVIKEIDKKGKFLDIGTGSGKLIQILSTEKSVYCIGVDTNEDMLKEANIKLEKKNIQLLKIEANKKLPFEDKSFDFITICSVLFHLKNEEIDFILLDAKRLLKDNGKIIVLTPTGQGGVFTLLKRFFSVKNLSVFIWFFATKNKAEIWTKNRYLEHYTSRNKLDYKTEIVMNGFAQLEIIQ